MSFMSLYKTIFSPSTAIEDTHRKLSYATENDLERLSNESPVSS